MQQSCNKRLEFIDVAKGITIIFVVMGHICEIKYLNTVIWSYHMAFFFIINGYFFNSLKYDFKKDFHKYVIPFFITCLLVAFYKLLFDSFDSFLLKLYAILYGSGYDYLNKPFLIVGVGGGMVFISTYYIKVVIKNIFFI